MSATIREDRAWFQVDYESSDEEQIQHREQNAADFPYDDLPCANSLRILSLAPGHSTEPISVSLETVSEDQIAGRLSSCKALSYIWGPPTRTQLMTCNGAKLKITPNLEDALHTLRSRFCRR
jgi:hypothetical protein